MRLPAEIVEAKRKAEAYVVKSSASGRFNVWRFRTWDLSQPGWRLVAIRSDRAAAETEILERLSLQPEQPKAVPADDDLCWFDWSGI